MRTHNLPNQIDINDVLFYRKQGGDFVAAAPAPIGGKGLVNPHVTRFLNRDGSITDIFHIKPVYYETHEGTWRPMSEVTTVHGNHRIALKPDYGDRMSLRFFLWLMRRQALLKHEVAIDYGFLGAGVQPSHFAFAASLTAYPDPSPETSTFDGYLVRGDSSGSGGWTTARNATDVGAHPDSVVNDNATNIVLRAMNDSGYGKCEMGRLFMLFDTSTLGAAATISAAVITITSDGKNVVDTGNYGVIVSSTPASNTLLASGDWDQVGSTELSNQLSFNSWGAAGATHDLTLNAGGIAAIAKTGISKFAIRSGYDINNTTPSNTNFGGGATYTVAKSADTTGTTSDPKLVVTYTATAPITGNFLSFMR